MPKQSVALECERCHTKYRVRLRKGGKKPSRGCPACGHENPAKTGE